jgi:LPS-assembly lipoprotein
MASVKRGPSLAATAALVGALLAGCGFHLRGAVEIPPELNPLYIEAPAGSPVRAAIEERLRGSAVRLASTSKEAKTILRISGESRSSRVAAVDRNGRVLAYELHFKVVFSAVAAQGRQLVAPSTLDMVRIYDNPDVEVLGKQLESELIYETLAQEAATSILFRLQAALRQH